MTQQPAGGRHVARFGVFELDVFAGDLRRAGVRVPLQDQPLRLLAILLERPGEVVTRDEIRSRLWPAGTFVEFDQGLNAAVRRVREALGDSADTPRFVETVPRRGYRFIAPVRGAAEPDRVARFPVDPQRDGVPQKAPVSLRRARWAVAAGLAACAMAGAVLWQVRDRGSAAPAHLTLAVLPFKPLVAAERDEALEFGATETLINQLSRLNGLRVRPLSSVRRYVQLNQDPIAAGRALGVQVVLEGSFQRDGAMTRYHVRLLDVATGSTRWADRAEASSTDLFALQDAIAERVADALLTQLTADDRATLARQSTSSPEAYLAYVRGRYHLWRRSSRDNRRALEFFQDAIRLDSEYAHAYAGLSEAYAATSNIFATADPHDVMPKAREAALTALQKDDSIAEAHTALGIVLSVYDYDQTGGQASFQRACELNPDGLVELNWYGHYLRSVGRFDEALAIFERALQVDPLSLEIHRAVAHVHYAARRFDQAIEWSQKTLDLDPNYRGAYVVLSWAYEAKGQYDDAVTARLRQTNPEGSGQQVIAARRAAYASGGWVGFWRHVLETSDAHLPRFLHIRAEILTKLGEYDEAFRVLDQAYDARNGYLHHLLTHAHWDPLRPDPRLEALLRRLNLRP